MKSSILCFISWIALHIVFSPINVLSLNNEEHIPGYIITLERDTIHGYIVKQDILNNHYKCQFLMPSDSVSKVYTPHDIYGYGFNEGMVYLSKTLHLTDFLRHIDIDLTRITTAADTEDLLNHLEYLLLFPEIPIEPMIKQVDGEAVIVQPIFLNLLFQGRVSLLKYRDMLFMHKVDHAIYLLQRYHEEIRKNNVDYLYLNKEYLKVILSFTSDCPEIRNSASKVTLSEKALISLLEEYSECINEDYLVLEYGDRYLFRVLPNISVAHSILSLKPAENNYENLSSFDNSKTIGYAGGVSFEFGLENPLREVFFSTGFFVTRIKFDPIETLSEGNEDFDFREDYYIFNFNSVSFPLIFNYKWKTYSLNPSVFIGGSLNSTRYNKYKQYSLFGFDDNDRILYNDYGRGFYKNEKLTFGLISGAGLRFQINQFLSFSANIHYQFTYKAVQLDNKAYGNFGGQHQLNDIINLHTIGLMLGFTLDSY